MCSHPSTHAGTNMTAEIYAPLEQPLLPMSLLRNPGYAATVCSALVGNMVYFSMR